MYIFGERYVSALFNRDIHPDGLSKAFTIIFLFRLLSETSNEPFAIWQITDRNYKPQVGVVLDRKPPLPMNYVPNV